MFSARRAYGTFADLTNGTIDSILTGAFKERPAASVAMRMLIVCSVCQPARMVRLSNQLELRLNLEQLPFRELSCRGVVKVWFSNAPSEEALAAL